MSIPAFARISRATTLTFAQREFVLAAEAAGRQPAADPRARDPAQRDPPADGLRLLVVGIAIVAEGSLAFLGLTVDRHDQLGRHDRRRLAAACSRSTSPTPRCSRRSWMFLTVLSVNFLGDRFRAAFDVKDAAL